MVPLFFDLTTFQILGQKFVKFSVVFFGKIFPQFMKSVVYVIFIIDNPVYFYLFQKLLKDSSDLLYTALNKKAFLKAVTIVVPSTWRDSKCQRIIHSPREDTPYRFVARILTLKKNCLNQKSGKTFFTFQGVKQFRE